MGNSKDISGIRPSFAICICALAAKVEFRYLLGPFCCLMWTSASLAPHLSHFMAVDLSQSQAAQQPLEKLRVERIPLVG
jgi:hypothetical protein